jgi:ribonuclease P/MRP protein subunit POP1
MDVVKKKALGRSFPKPGKDKRITRTASFLKRQRSFISFSAIRLRSHFNVLGNKVWLETHLWHAKRMHMENLWGYRLVCRPSALFIVSLSTLDLRLFNRQRRHIGLRTEPQFTT